ncbi:MAG: AAA family ATPase [Pseudomonadota bacterium]
MLNNRLHLRRLSVHGFKSLDNFHSDLEPALTIFIGQNGAGKSTILQIFSFIQAFMSGEPLRFFEERAWLVETIKPIFKNNEIQVNPIFSKNLVYYVYINYFMQSTKSKIAVHWIGIDQILFNVSSGGKRGEVPLTAEQKAEIDDYLTNFKLDGVTIRIVDDTNLNTGYAHGEMFSILNIGSDVAPGNVGIGTLTANSIICIKGTLAHEIVGHREAALAGRTQDILSREEAQASIRAARFAPYLDSTERFRLLRDGINIREVKNKLFIQQR